MRVAMFVALILMMVTPSKASVSCMSLTEARQHFGSVHIYWHGRNHCWDASSGRQQHFVVHTITAKPDQRKWRNAMSELEPDVQVAAKMAPAPQEAQIIWQDRWVDMQPSELPSQATPSPAVEPPTSSIPNKFEFETHKPSASFSLLLIFAFLVIALPLTMIVAMPHGMIYLRRSE
jgi:hypothetical protein